MTVTCTFKINVHTGTQLNSRAAEGTVKDRAHNVMGHDNLKVNGTFE